MGTELENDVMTFEEHYAELAARLLRISLTVLVTFLLTGFLWKIATSLFYSITLAISGGSLEPMKDTPSDRWLWAAFFAFLAGFYSVVRHVMAFVEPGLYPDERKVLRVSRLWLYISLLLSITLPGIIVRLSGIFSFVSSVAILLDMKALVIRCLLSALLTTCFLTIPRSRNSLTPIFFVLTIPLIWLAPDHFMFTVVVGIVELSVPAFIFSFAILLNLSERLRGPS